MKMPNKPKPRLKSATAQSCFLYHSLTRCQYDALCISRAFAQPLSCTDYSNRLVYDTFLSKFVFERLNCTVLFPDHPILLVGLFLKWIRLGKTFNSEQCIVLCLENSSAAIDTLKIVTEPNSPLLWILRFLCELNFQVSLSLSQLKDSYPSSVCSFVVDYLGDSLKRLDMAVGQERWLFGLPPLEVLEVSALVPSPHWPVFRIQTRSLSIYVVDLDNIKESYPLPKNPMLELCKISVFMPDGYNEIDELLIQLNSINPNMEVDLLFNDFNQLPNTDQFEEALESYLWVKSLLCHRIIDLAKRLNLRLCSLQIAHMIRQPFVVDRIHAYSPKSTFKFKIMDLEKKRELTSLPPSRQCSFVYSETYKALKFELSIHDTIGEYPDWSSDEDEDSSSDEESSDSEEESSDDEEESSDSGEEYY